MSRSLALAMTRPHERLGLPQPLGRRLPHGLFGWNVLLAAVTITFAVAYVVQVNRASARGFQLRDVETRVESLKNNVTSLEDQVAMLSSYQAMSDRAATLGYVPVDHVEFVNPAGHSFALAK